MLCVHTLTSDAVTSFWKQPGDLVFRSACHRLVYLGKSLLRARSLVSFPTCQMQEFDRAGILNYFEMTWPPFSCDGSQSPFPQRNVLAETDANFHLLYQGPRATLEPQEASGCQVQYWRVGTSLKRLVRMGRPVWQEGNQWCLSSPLSYSLRGQTSSPALPASAHPMLSTVMRLAVQREPIISSCSVLC